MRPVEAIEVVPQATEASEPHVPENNCNRAPEPDKLAEILLSEMVGFVFVATNLYHTSSSEVPVQLPTETPELVAPVTAPCALKQLIAVGNK